MKTPRTLLVLALAASAAGCGRAQIRYSPPERPYELKADRLQPVSSIDFVDDSGGVQTGGTGLWLLKPYFKTFQEAMRTQFAALRVAPAPGAPQRLEVHLTEAVVKRSGGLSADISATTTYVLKVKRGDADACSVETSGWATLPEGFHAASTAASKALENALTKAVDSLGPQLASSCLYGPATPEAAAAAPRGDGPLSDADLPEPGPGDSRALALIIGVERYRGGLSSAPFAAADARDAARYLKNVFGLQQERMAVLTDDQVTRADLEKYLERWLPDRAAPEGRVIVYFAGRGAVDPRRGEGYLLPYDGDPEYLPQTAYPLQRLFADLGRLPGPATVILDAGFAGEGDRSALPADAKPLAIVEPVPPVNMVQISAASPGQPALSDQARGHGLFTYWLLRALKEKRTDLHPAFDWLKPSVVKDAEARGRSQTPEWRQRR